MIDAASPSQTRNRQKSRARPVTSHAPRPGDKGGQGGGEDDEHGVADSSARASFRQDIDRECRSKRNNDRGDECPIVAAPCCCGRFGRNAFLVHCLPLGAQPVPC